MLLALLTGFIIVSGAAFLGIMERALSPDLHKFPCVNPFTRICMRVYTIAIFAVGARMLSSAWIGPVEAVTPFRFFASSMMCLTHGAMTYQVLKMKRPAGFWLWFSNRQKAAHRLAIRGVGMDDIQFIETHGGLVATVPHEMEA